MIQGRQFHLGYHNRLVTVQLVPMLVPFISDNDYFVSMESIGYQGLIKTQLNKT